MEKGLHGEETTRREDYAERRLHGKETIQRGDYTERGLNRERTKWIVRKLLGEGTIRKLYVVTY